MNIEINTKENGSTCVGCIVEAKSPRCGSLMEALTGIDCDKSGVIFVRPETWEACSRENTKAGDKVRFRSTMEVRELEYIAKFVGSGGNYAVLVNDGKKTFNSYLNGYEINTTHVQDYG